MNLYAYVHNRPTMAVDPRGLGPCDESWWQKICRWTPKVSLCLGGAYFFNWIVRAGWQAYQGTQDLIPDEVAAMLEQACMCAEDGTWVTVVIGGVTYGYYCASGGPIYSSDGEEESGWEETPIQPRPGT